MIVLLMIIFCILMFTCIILYNMHYEDTWFWAAVISTILFGVSVMLLIFLLIDYPYNADLRLDMYQEENQVIETKIKETVKAYMNYEQETYKSLIENADLQTLLIKYPELSSNELVKMEIDTYKENNNKIKEIKEQKINRKVMGFWLFFNIGVKD